MPVAIKRPMARCTRRTMIETRFYRYSRRRAFASKGFRFWSRFSRQRAASGSSSLTTRHGPHAIRIHMPHAQQERTHARRRHRCRAGEATDARLHGPCGFSGRHVGPAHARGTPDTSTHAITTVAGACIPRGSFGHLHRSSSRPPPARRYLTVGPRASAVVATRGDSRSCSNGPASICAALHCHLGWHAACTHAATCEAVLAASAAIGSRAGAASARDGEGRRNGSDEYGHAHRSKRHQHAPTRLLRRAGGGRAGG